MGQKISTHDQETLKKLQELTHQDRKELMWEYRKFKRQFPSGSIDLPQFKEFGKKAMPSNQASDDFLEHLFHAFDKDRSGTIDFEEFILAMAMCSSEKPEDKLRFSFRSLDTSGEGFLTKKDIKYAIEVIFKNNPGIEGKVAEEVNTPEKVTEKVFEKIDSDNDGRIHVEEMVDFMNKDPSGFEYLGLNLVFLS